MDKKEQNCAQKPVVTLTLSTHSQELDESILSTLPPKGGGSDVESDLNSHRRDSESDAFWLVADLPEK